MQILAIFKLSFIHDFFSRNESKVIESHPDNELPDLRLDQPFDELKAHCDMYDLKTLSRGQQSHIPYLVLLYKYVTAWKSQVNKTNMDDYNVALVAFVIVYS